MYVIFIFNSKERKSVESVNIIYYIILCLVPIPQSTYDCNLVDGIRNQSYNIYKCCRWQRWGFPSFNDIFYRENQPVLYMAGLYNRYRDEDRFVILTTVANESMKPVHDRMPLLLDRDEIGKWLFEDSLTEAFLQKTPALLERRADFEQMSLFPVENSNQRK